MTDKLIKGKWYIWTGPKDFQENWSDEMELIKDSVPRKWLGEDGITCGKFTGMRPWAWGHALKYLQEVGDGGGYVIPPDELHVGDKVKNVSCNYRLGEVCEIVKIAGSNYHVIYSDGVNWAHQKSCLIKAESSGKEEKVDLKFKPMKEIRKSVTRSIKYD